MQKEKQSYSVYIFIQTGPLRSKTSSTENLHNSSNSVHDTVPTAAEPPPTPPEEVFTVELRREDGQKLGLGVIGGVDNSSLRDIHVRELHVTTL